MFAKETVDFTTRSPARKIAIFLPSLQGGGAERAMVDLANGIAEAGHQVDLVLARALGPYLSEVAPDVSIIDLGRPRVTRALPALAAYLRRERPAALLSALSHANVIAVLASRLTGTQTHVVLSEQASTQGYRRNYAGLRHRLIRAAMRATYRAADAVVPVAEAMVADLVRELRLDPARVRAIPNPLVSDRLLQLAALPPTHPWMEEPVPVVLAVGRLSPEKDFAALIRAFARIRAPARLLILGEGSERASLEALVEELGLADRAALPGFDPNPFAYMGRAALFVLSSRYEGLPGVLIQAMACGCPVVATDCPTGPREILEDGRWGDLAPVGDVAGLAEAMAAALARDVHPDVRRRAADYGVETAVQKYLSVLLPGEGPARQAAATAPAPPAAAATAGEA